MSEDPLSRADTAAIADEAELVSRLQAGEDAAYEEMVRTQAGRMLAVARRILRDDDEAQDAVQEAFLSAFKAIGNFSGQSRLGTWLHRIVVNAALMRRRKRQNIKEVAIEDLMPKFQDDGHHLDPPAPWREGSEAILDSKELQELVRKKIDSLPENYREVLTLRDIEQLDTRETAEILKITPNAVKVRLHRAHVALQGLLDPHMRTGEVA